MSWRQPASSFKLRIAATIFCLEAVMVVLVLFATLRGAADTVRAEMDAADRQATAMFQDLARVALVNDEYGSIQSVIEQAHARGRLRHAALIDLSGMIVASSDPAQIGTRLPDRAGTSGWPLALVEIGSDGYHSGWLALDFSDEVLAAAYHQALRQGLAVALASMAVIALVGFTLGHLLTRRLARLAAVAEAVSSGATSQRARLAGSDEVARVGRAFDGMVDRLERLLEAVRLDRDRMILPTEAIHEGFALWDGEDRLVRCNERLRELLGESGRFVVPGLPFRRFVRLEAGEIVPGEGTTLGAWVRGRILRHRLGSTGQEHGYRDGRWARVSESRMPDGGTISIYTDISETKRRELELHDNERRLQAIMASVHDGIIVLDRRWRVDALNPAAKALFAVAEPLPARLGFDDLLRAADEIEGAKGPSLVGRGPTELTGRRADGGTFTAEVTVSALDGQDRPGYIATVRDITRRKADQERILFHATHDPLTGLPNRRLFDDRLRTALRNAARRGEMVAVALLDLDRFKAINDGLGHAAGDELLVNLAKRFSAALRASDTVARLGGDEFIFLFTGLEIADDALPPAAKVLEAARAPMLLEERQLLLSASIGISLFPTDGVEPDTLLKHADAALYRAKARGRNRCEMFDPAMVAQAVDRAALANDLRQARARRQLRLLYQPQVDLETGKLVGFEALMRWRHPSRGLIGPEQFIQATEDPALIASLGSWTLRRACRDLAGRELEQASLVRVAVGLPSRHVPLAELVGQVERSLAEAGLQPGRLEVELAETALLEDDPATEDALDRLHGLGVGLALGHLGTGFATLSRLRRYRLTRLKIDRSFVQAIARSGSDAAVAGHVIAMARELGMTVLADGVETPEQLALLRELGCQEGQGELLGQPVKSAELPELLARAA